MDDVIEEVRVLVIDHDQNSLNDLTNKLREFNYEVMSNEEGMDAFMAKGARDCLIKPISNESLKYLWKHTVKKCKNMEQSSNYVDEGNVLLLAQDDNMNNGEVEDMNMDSQSPTSKKRVVWTSDIEIPFLEAVNELGERACPKAILEHMNKSNPKSNLTRQNIASHLQKHRLRQKNSSGKTENKGAANPSADVRQNGVEDAVFMSNVVNNYASSSTNVEDIHLREPPPCQFVHLADLMK
ncbi:putative two-component response regulator ARR20 [Acorus calamus]|uniref:Two-component response regulator ARR20 n=1 Tax=Acorus calamus TaxID=4465 RepID=A0AAV9CSK3_ACOCL|nr:putative two-component response regulator ARR20 [Acorus calamus]